MGKRDRGDAIAMVLCVMALLSVLMLTLLLSGGFVSRHAASEARRQQTKVYAQSFLDALLSQREEGEWGALLDTFVSGQEETPATYGAGERDGYTLSVTLRTEKEEMQTGVLVSVTAYDCESGDSYTSEAFLLDGAVERRR